MAHGLHSPRVDGPVSVEPVLHAVAEAAGVLLRTNWRDGISEALGRLGRAVGFASAFLCENVQGESGSQQPQLRYLWRAGLAAPEEAGRTSSPLEQAAWQEGWAQLTHQGNPATGAPAQLPAPLRDILGVDSLKAMLLAPIVAKGVMWGLIGVACHERFCSDLAAKEGINLLANLIGSALEREAAHDALQQSEAELRALFAAMNDVILVVDHEGRYLKVAPTAPDLLYRPPQELLGRLISEVFEKPMSDRFNEVIARALSTRTKQRMEYSLLIKGQECWFSASVSPLGDDNVVFVARDVTARREAEAALRQAEAKYRSIFENAVEGIFQTTPEGRYMDANPSLARIYGYDNANELTDALTDIGSQLYVHPHSREQFIAEMRTTGSVSNFEAQVLPQGRRNHLDFGKRPRRLRRRRQRQFL